MNITWAFRKQRLVSKREKCLGAFIKNTSVLLNKRKQSLFSSLLFFFCRLNAIYILSREKGGRRWELQNHHTDISCNTLCREKKASAIKHTMNWMLKRLPPTHTVVALVKHGPLVSSINPKISMQPSWLFATKVLS